MITFPRTRWQEQQPSDAYPMGEPPQSSALDLLSREFPSTLAPELRCKSMDIVESLDISETRIPFPHGEIVVTQTHTEVRYSFTVRSGVEGKK